MKHIITILAGVIICSFAANAAQDPSDREAPQSFVAKSSTAPNIVYVGTHNDGELILRVSASGRNKADALAVAEKYALRQVMLTGIQGPDKANLTRPLIFEVNAEEKYEDFFNAFFSHGGVYKNFVSSEDRRAGSDVKKTGKESVRLQTTLRVLRPALREYLIECNIIKK